MRLMPPSGAVPAPRHRTHDPLPAREKSCDSEHGEADLPTRTLRSGAPRLDPSGPSFPWKESRIRPQALREDRILHEIHATGGDVRRIYDLFGLSVESATRYIKTIEHPDPRNEGHPGTRP